MFHTDRLIADLVLGFYINLPIGALVAIPIISLHIPEQMNKKPAFQVLSEIHRHLDLIGFALLAPAVVQLLLALEYGGNQFAWNSSQIIGLFIGAFATFVVWAFWNRHKGDSGLLPVSIMSRRVVWASALNNAFQMSTLFGTSYWLPIYFQAIKGVSAILSGVYLLPTILGQLVFAVLSGVLGELHTQSNISVNMLMTWSSIQSGLYTPFLYLCCYPYFSWLWFILSTPTGYVNRKMGWFPTDS